MVRFNIYFFFCTLGGLKEENMGVEMRWYALNSPITTPFCRQVDASVYFPLSGHR